MSEKFNIDSSKFLYNDEFIENDCEILELVSNPVVSQQITINENQQTDNINLDMNQIDLKNDDSTTSQ